MGNGYKNQVHPQSMYQRNSLFLPMLCRISMRDVRLTQYTSDRSSSSFSDEPSSPRVSCVGQVKRNNKIIGFPNTPSKSSITTHHSHFKYSKLKKFFSSKNLITAAAATTTANNANSREIIRRGVATRKERSDKNGGDCKNIDNGVVGVININELDPPLPVIKKVKAPGGGGGGDRDEGNLWKRRFGGAALIQGLQIEQIHHFPNNNCLPPPPTV